jgi:hypothetical protein
MRRACLSLLPLFAGCYSYAAIDPASATPGVDVRARISATAAERIAPLLGAETRVLTGRLIDNAAATMIVEVPSVSQSTRSGVMETLHQRVSITRGDLLELETRRLDRFRTGAIVGGAAILAGGVLINSMHGGPGLDRVSPGGGNDTRRVPLPQIRIRLPF